MRSATVQARMTNPAVTVAGAFKALQVLGAAAAHDELPLSTVNLVHLRASQINGCSVCVDMHARMAKRAGESDERLFAVAAWRDAPYFNEAERAALELTEAVTRISDRPDPVTDEIWQLAAEHYDQPALAALLLQITLINTWNRLNVATRQVAGTIPF